ncbi:MAG: glycosyltransferase family 2 protein [Bacteroidales bacterium]|jgi:glycosyltransferase involved in cell wall biosynthesis|nr:glycosyltransferase family 2 protein [Bacteroidales bacterium]
MISVIMPVYNAEKFLNESIVSLKNQSYQDWELIAVDDGSTDNSLDILRQFAQKDSRIKVFHKENGGATYARMFALNYCCREFILELDADDSISEDCFEKMLFSQQKHHCDVVVGELFFVENNKLRPFDAKHPSKIGAIVLAPNIIELALQYKLHSFVLWKSEIYKKGYKIENLNFSSFNSDEFLSNLLFGLCDSFVYSEGKYFYNLHPQSITHNIQFYRFDVIKTALAYIDFCRQNNISKKTTGFVIQNAIGIWVYYRIFRIKYSRCFSKEGKIYVKNLLKNSAFRLKKEKIGRIFTFKSLVKITLFRIMSKFYA